MMMEDAMEDHTDTHSLYILIASLLGSVIALPAVWYFTEAPTLLLVSLPNELFRLCNDGSCSNQHALAIMVQASCLATVDTRGLTAS